MQAGGSLYVDTTISDQEVRTISASKGCGSHRSTRRMTRGSLQLFFDSRERWLGSVMLVASVESPQGAVIHSAESHTRTNNSLSNNSLRLLYSAAASQAEQKRSTANRRSDKQFRIRSPHHCYIAACHLQAAKDRASILSINTFKRSCDSMAG